MSTPSITPKITTSADTVFSYAAAASGKHSPKPTTPNTSIPPASIIGGNITNGTTPPTTTTTATTTNINQQLDPPSPIEMKRDSKTKSKSAQTTSSANATAGTLNGEPITSIVSTTDVSSTENDAQSEKIQSEHPNTGTEAPKSVETKEKLIPAPAPTVNIWKVRADARAASPATALSNALAEAATKPQIEVADKPVDQKQDARRKPHHRAEAPATGNEKKEEGQVEQRHTGRDSKDRKKSTDGRANGPTRDEGAPRHGKGKTPRQPANREAAPELPPPLADTMSWPTPMIAQEEEKREQERLQKEEREREKPPTPARPTKFVPAPFTPNIVHNEPLPARGGRGGRGPRGRGGSSAASTGDTRSEKNEAKSERQEGSTGNQTASPPATAEREKANTRNFNNRGGHHSGRGGRRGGMSSNPNRQSPPSAVITDGKPAAEQSAQPRGPASPARSNVNPVQTNTDTKGQDSRNPSPPKHHDDGAFVGQGVIPPLYTGRPQRSHSHSYSGSSGQGYQQPMVPPTIADAPMLYPQARPDRNASGHRGNFGGRNRHFSSHHAHTQLNTNTMPNHLYPQPHPPQSQTYNAPRGNFRGRLQQGNSTRPLPQGYPQAGYVPYNVPTVYYDAMAPQPEDSQKDEYTNGLLSQLRSQIEYYFSIDNLCKDMFLRKNMDNDGFVSLGLIASFGMVKRVNPTIELLCDAISKSNTLELVAAYDGYRVRRAKNFDSFILPQNQRDPSCQYRSTKFKQQMSAAAPVFHPSSQSPSAATPTTHPFAQSPPSTTSALPSSEEKTLSNGTHINGLQRSGSQLSADALEFNPSTTNSTHHNSPRQHPTVVQPAEYSDDKLAQIHVLYRKSLLTDLVESPSPIDVFCLQESPACEVSTTEHESQASMSPAHSKWFKKYGVSFSVGPLDSKNYTEIQEPYTTLRTNALHKRLEGSPLSSKMIILYKFWIYFLTQHFNQEMYEEFKTLATEDSAVTNGRSAEFLFDYYFNIHTTLGHPRPELAQDFVSIVQKEKSPLGYNALKGALRNPNIADGVRLALDSAVTADLRKCL